MIFQTNPTGFGKLLLLLILLPFAQPTLSGGQAPLPQIKIRIGEATLITELAVTPRQRFNGLSGRESLAEDQAMLFVYKREQPLQFTMRGTSIPLSIAFIDNELIIREILDMEPFEHGPYPSSAQARYALEVRQGWFDRHNISVGDKIHPEGQFTDTQ